MKKKKQYKEYDDETLQRIQQVELEILKDFMDICDRHGLTYLVSRVLESVRYVIRDLFRGMMTLM